MITGENNKINYAHGDLEALDLPRFQMSVFFFFLVIHLKSLIYVLERTLISFLLSTFLDSEAVYSQLNLCQLPKNMLVIILGTTFSHRLETPTSILHSSLQFL